VKLILVPGSLGNAHNIDLNPVRVWLNAQLVFLFNREPEYQDTDPNASDVGQSAFAVEQYFRLVMKGGNATLLIGYDASAVIFCHMEPHVHEKTIMVCSPLTWRAVESAIFAEC
jgi:hypothetical protein